MSKNIIPEMSNEELLNLKKTTVVISVMLTMMLALLLGFGIYISITQKFSPLLAVPFALSPTAILNFKKLKEINQELIARDA